MICASTECSRPARTKGLCQRHYMRLYRNGSVDNPGKQPAKRPKDVPFPDWFWSHFARRGDCLEWTRMTVQNRGGQRYGHVRHEGRMQRVHRVAWVLANGPIPEGMHVCHSCDNTLCGNPEHLFLGTHADNMADKVSKGRQARIGEHRTPDGRVSYS